MFARLACALSSLALACAPDPAFQAADTATSTTTTDAATDTDVGETADDPCDLCRPGEACVQGECVSCAGACAALVADGQCGDDGCGGTCGCSAPGPCADRTCACLNADCATVVTSAGAASAALTFGRRDVPLVGIAAGGGRVTRNYAVIEWIGGDFDTTTADPLVPVNGPASLLETADGVLHALHSGAATAPNRPRHLVRAARGWTAAPLGDSDCVAPRLAWRKGAAPALVAGCYQVSDGALVLWTWAPETATWEPLTTSPGVDGVLPELALWPSAFAWVVANDGVISNFAARKTRPGSVVSVARRSYDEPDGWSQETEFGVLTVTDPTFRYAVRVALDATDIPHLIVRDLDTQTPPNVVLRHYFPAGAPTIAAPFFTSPTPDAARGLDAVGGPALEVALNDGAGGVTLQRFDPIGLKWSEVATLPLPDEDVDALVVARDALGAAHVAIVSDGTTLRLWAPTGTPPASR